MKTLLFLLLFSSFFILEKAYSQQITYSFEGLERKYLYYEPTNLPDNAPLIVVMHGYGDNNSAIRNYSGMNNIADIYGFAVCYPRGTRDNNGNGSRFFNVGYDFNLGIDTVNDLGFIEALAVYLQQTHNLDPQRTYATGMSNGGDMCYKIACHGSGVFKAVAPVAGMVLQSIVNTNSNYTPIPILEIHGTEDNVTYWEGDMNNIDGWGAYPSIPNMIDYFADLNGSTTTIIDTLPNSNTTDGSNVIREKYSQIGSNCNQVWLYKIIGGGHDWPGASGNMDINPGVEMVQFFEEVYCANTTGITSEPIFDISIYPNPSSDVLNIETNLHMGLTEIHFYSSIGQCVKSISCTLNTTMSVSLTELPDGIYYIKLTSKNIVLTKKVVIKRD